MAKRTILMTGCSSGIGRHAAFALRDRGWRVFAACRQASDCAALQSEGFDAPRIDYQDPATIHAGLAEVLDATGGRLDALFNNGAYATPGLVEDLPTEALRAIFEANFFGWHTLTRAVLPVMRDQKAGRIVQCSSVLGFVAMPWRGAYNATKFALEGLTDTLRLEMHGSGIHVILIAPGPIRTRIRPNSIPHFERWIDWQNSARAEEYAARLRKRLYAQALRPDPFELGPEAVTDKLIHALDHPRPQPRYFVTRLTYIAAALRRLLPARLFDHIIMRMT